MKPRTLFLPFVAALGLLAPTPVLAAPSGKSIRRARTRVRAPASSASKLRQAATLSQSPRAEQSKAAIARVRQEGTARLAAALLNYADGKRRSKGDRAIAKALDAVPGGSTTAKRLAAEIRAQPANVRKAHLGAHAGALTSPTSPKRLEQLAAQAVSAGFDPTTGLVAQRALPPEMESVPTSFPYRLAGVRATKIQDADGSDELVVVTKIASWKVGKPLEAYMFEAGAPTIDIGSGQTVTTSIETNLHIQGTYFIVTGVAEADGSRTQTEQNIEVAIELARAAAKANGNTINPMAAFAAELEFAEGVLALASPNSAPSLNGTPTTGGIAKELWAAKPGTIGGVEYKGSTKHEPAAGGEYTLLWDVPHAFADHAKIKVLLSSVKADEPLGIGEHLRVEVKIGDQALTEDYPLHDDLITKPLLVTRQMLPGKRVPIEVRVVRAAAVDRVLDTTPGPGKGSTKMTYDPETNTLYGPAGVAKLAKAGESLKLDGGDATLTLSVSDGK